MGISLTPTLDGIAGALLKTNTSGSPAANPANEAVFNQGKLPPVRMIIYPFKSAKPKYTVNRFLSYNFSSSILIPVDTFSCEMAFPDDIKNIYEIINCGDNFQIIANEQPISTMRCDSIRARTDTKSETVSVNGRDFLGQLEDQDAVNINADPMWGNKYDINQVLRTLTSQTQIRGWELRDCPTNSALFATEPSESKLAALQRYLEPFNCLAWTGPSGKLIIGKPNFKQESKGLIINSREKRKSNVLEIEEVRSLTQLPTTILPIWSGQETVQARVSKDFILQNALPEVIDLIKSGHCCPKTIVVSTPQGSGPQDLTNINLIAPGSATFMQWHAKSKMARENQRASIIRCKVPGHYNYRGEPYVPDTCYNVTYDRVGIYEEKRYLYQVDYNFSVDSGQTTELYFCKIGTIVSDVKVF